jgi:hypothetical protein
LIGGGFQFEKSSTTGKVPKTVTWFPCPEESGVSKKYDESFYVDRGFKYGLEDINDGRTKYGLIFESRIYAGHCIHHVKQKTIEFKKAFKYIFTHNKELLNLDSSLFKWCPAYGSWIHEVGIHKKSKVCSIISSKTKISKQQSFRVQVARELKHSTLVDSFGRGGNYISKKEDGLNDYMFSIAIENDSYETYFTEKIIDCFQTGTVPIYMGAPDIGDHFNIDGIIQLKDIREKNGKYDLDILTPELYQSMKGAIEDNYNRSLQYDVSEDWIYKNYFEECLS